MRPGRELDCEIAKEIFQRNVFVKKRELYEQTPEGDRPLRRYSKDIEAAWEIVEKLDISIMRIEGGQWFAIVGPGNGWRSPAEFIQYLQTGNFAEAGAALTPSAPLTICLAALKTVEKRVAENPEASEETTLTRH